MLDCYTFVKNYRLAMHFDPYAVRINNGVLFSCIYDLIYLMNLMNLMNLIVFKQQLFRTAVTSVVSSALFLEVIIECHFCKRFIDYQRL